MPFPTHVPPPEFLKCALDPRNKLCQIYASLSKSSTSFSVQSLVGKACRNIMISYSPRKSTSMIYPFDWEGVRREETNLKIHLHKLF